MYVLIERNNDGCWMETSLVSASDDHSKLEHLMAERFREALNGPFDYILPLTEYDDTYCFIEPNYASLGCDGDGELIEWYIFDASDKSTWHTTC